MTKAPQSLTESIQIFRRICEDGPFDPIGAKKAINGGNDLKDEIITFADSRAADLLNSLTGSPLLKKIMSGTPDEIEDAFDLLRNRLEATVVRSIDELPNMAKSETSGEEDEMAPELSPDQYDDLLDDEDGDETGRHADEDGDKYNEGDVDEDEFDENGEPREVI